MKLSLLTNNNYYMLRKSEVIFPVEVEGYLHKGHYTVTAEELRKVGFTHAIGSDYLFGVGSECIEVEEKPSKKLIGFKIKNKNTGYWYRSYCKGMVTSKEDAHINPVDFLTIGYDNHCFVKGNCTLFPVYN